MKVIPNPEDKMIWKENKTGSYLVKLMYELLNFNTPVSLFSLFGIPWCSQGWVFFCLGGFLGQGLDFGTTQTKGKITFQ